MSRYGGFIGTVTGMGCFLQAILLGLYLWAATWATDVITNAFGLDLPWFADMLIGLFTGWVGFWIAVIISLAT